MFLIGVSRASASVPFRVYRRAVSNVFSHHVAGGPSLQHESTCSPPPKPRIGAQNDSNRNGGAGVAFWAIRPFCIGLDASWAWFDGRASIDTKSDDVWA